MKNFLSFGGTNKEYFAKWGKRGVVFYLVVATLIFVASLIYPELGHPTFNDFIDIPLAIMGLPGWLLQVWVHVSFVEGSFIGVWDTIVGLLFIVVPPILMVFLAFWLLGIFVGWLLKLRAKR